MATSREKLIDILSAKYPKLPLRPAEDFRKDFNGGIWSSGEHGIEATDGFRLFDYYAEDWREITYILGVHREIYELLESHGWFAEWYDCGTIMFWII